MQVQRFLLGVMISILVLAVYADAPQMGGNTLAINIEWFWEIALLIAVSVAFLRDRKAS
jgi:hypothetical protein